MDQNIILVFIVFAFVYLAYTGKLTYIIDLISSGSSKKTSSFRQSYDNKVVSSSPEPELVVEQDNPSRYDPRTSDRSWNSYVAGMELDDGTIESHDDFIKGIRVFTGTPSFTDIADDNRSDIFTNFIGLRRPEYIPIREGTRQLPEVDESVLLRNSNLRW